LLKNTPSIIYCALVYEHIILFYTKDLSGVYHALALNTVVTRGKSLIRAMLQLFEQELLPWYFVIFSPN
jgi:hypothetical protein